MTLTKKVFIAWFLAFAMIIGMVPFSYADATDNIINGIGAPTVNDGCGVVKEIEPVDDGSDVVEEIEPFADVPSPFETYANVSLDAQNIGEPYYKQDFSNDAGLNVASGAWVENGVIVLPGGEGSYATVDNINLNGLGNSITIFFNARLFSGPSFPANTERTLLAIGVPAGGDKPVETALYVYATSNSIRAAISNGTQRKEISVTGSANILNNPQWRSFALSYSPADGGTLVFYTQGVQRGKLIDVGVNLMDILTASGAKFYIGQSIQVSPLVNPVQSYRGSLDNIMIWNSVLSSADIAEMHVRQRMLRDLQHLRLDDEQSYMFNEQGIHNPVIHDVMLFPISRGIGTGEGQRYPISYRSSDENILRIESDNLGNDIFARFNEDAVDNVVDKTVTLTATITAPDPNNPGEFITADKDLVLTIPSWKTRRQMDYDAIVIHTLDDVRENLPLFSKGKNGSNISWKSSDPTVVSDTPIPGIDDPFPGGGVVKRPGVGEDPVNVTLTATITMDGVPGELTKEFDLTITPLSEGRGTPSHENARYLFTFYAEGYDWDEDGETTEEMYFAISPDASQWRTLNLKTRPDGSHYTEPIFKSTMGDMGLRDAHFVRSPDGDRFYAMATDLHWSGTVLSRRGFKEGYLSHGATYDGAAMNRTIAIWNANSLTSWGEQRLVRAASQTAGNAFAPESIWDNEKQAHLVYWQQNENDKLDSDGNYIPNPQKVGVMYKCYTRDFFTFTEPEFWYGYDDVKEALVYNNTKYVVDTHIAFDESDGYYYRFASTNRCFVERSKSLDGPWVDLTPIYHGNSNREGATTFQLPDGSWSMMLDNFRTYVRYDMTKTGGLADLLVGPVESIAEGEAKFKEQVYEHPAIALNEGLTNQRPGSSGGTVSSLRMKHGMIMLISEAEYWQLIAKYGTMDYPALGWVVDSITVKPGKAVVGSGSETTFEAEVLGEDNPSQSVVWSVEGATSAETQINPATGVLTVANDEASKSLIVRATHAHEYFSTISGTATVTVSSEAEVPAAVLTADNSVKPEDTFTVGIGLNNLEQIVHAHDITLSYDPDVFEYVSASGVGDNIIIVKEDKATVGKVRLIAANIGGVSGESTPVMNITFKVKGGVENTAGIIAITSAKLGVGPQGTVIQATLDSKSVAIGSSEPTIDKTALIMAIDNAQSLYDAAVVGTQPGQYPQEAKDALNTAINEAKAVRDDSSATQAEIDSAVAALNNAVDIFKAAVVEEATPDINNDGNINVGDIALVAYYYDKDWTDTEWQIAKAADMNGDGKIDIEDLAYVASNISD